MKESFMMKSVVTNKAIHVHVIGNGCYLKSFICNYCENEQSKGGIELYNCKHLICYKCFTKYINKCIRIKVIINCVCNSESLNYDDLFKVRQHFVETEQ